ncbi:MAG: prolyl oligopeptidase family serine peptidase [Acidobacteriota bacterium]
MNREPSRHTLPFLLIALLGLAAGGAAAPPSQKANPDPRWTVEDVIRAETARDWTLSADGRFAAWVRSRIAGKGDDEKRSANLWLSPLADDGEAYPLTRGKHRVKAPRFSPDGRHLAFLWSRPLPDAGEKDPAGQLWVLPLRGGEPWPVTRFDRPIADFRWRDDERLVVAAAESRSADERQAKERADTTEVVEDRERTPPVRLYGVDLDGEVSRLTENRHWIDSLSVSPDGRWAVVTEQQSLSFGFDGKTPPKTFLVDLATGTLTERFADGRLRPYKVRWAPNSRGFYLANEFSSHPIYRTATVTELHFHHLESGVTEAVDLGERGLGGDYHPTADGVIALVADGVRYRPVLATVGGEPPRNITGTHVRNLDRWALAADGRTVVYSTSSVVSPPQPFVAQLAGTTLSRERPLVELNQRWRGKPTGRREVLRWQGALGDEVEGILSYPLDWREGRRYPLILDIHGGPTGTDMDRWSERWPTPNILWRQQGAFILQVNYHGSAGYGLAWAESIANRYYELEIPDIEAGVDLLIERGLVDADRLGTSGWSNGGILSAELITRTQRYRAASVGAADVEWFSDWGWVDFGATFDNYYFGGPPWERVDHYLAKSPFFRLTEVTTPTLVFTGTEDRNVPPHQSWSLFRALQQIGKAPTRLVIFPGEPHGLQKIAHQRRKMEEDLAWFDRYLFDQVRETQPALLPDSPLAALLERATAARRGAAYGRQIGPRLIPEAVPFRQLQVARFEVTRAQWAAFEPSLEVDPLEHNLPMTGVSFERAQAYAAWLAEVTGEAWRLPTLAEARALAAAAGSDGNTFEHWAGYAPNPDDRRRLEARLGAAFDGQTAPLLLSVGSLPGHGDPALFDLDGNAAEWAIGEDGEGVAHGASADRASDPRTDSPGEAAPLYTGLRVVRNAD